MAFRYIRNIIIFTFLAVSPLTVFGEYNSLKLGKAIGGYLFSVGVLEEFGNAECGYVIKKKYSIDDAANSTIMYLSASDQKDLKQFLQGPTFKREIKEYINGFRKAGLKDGLDEKTLCGFMASNIALIHQSAKVRLEEAIKLYSK